MDKLSFLVFPMIRKTWDKMLINHLSDVRKTNTTDMKTNILEFPCFRDYGTTIGFPSLSVIVLKILRILFLKTS